MNTNKQAPATHDLPETLEADNYILGRLNPKPSEYYYLHLVDLRQALVPYASTKAIRILDYGCGGSPYRSLFPNSEYLRADFTHCNGLDYVLPEDSTVPMPDCSVEMVLSTQVLEHVSNPAHYVAECFRVLKPGGSLLLTTHGLFHDHGCPYDFQRWTADGLRRLIEQAGFRVDEVKKLTCGSRALCSLLHQGIFSMHAPKTSLFGFCLWGLRGLWRVAPGWLNRAADKYFSQEAVVDAKDPTAILYVALLVHATRPEA